MGKLACTWLSCVVVRDNAQHGGLPCYSPRLLNSLTDMPVNFLKRALK